MADPKLSDSDAISSTEHSDTATPMKEINEKDISVPAPRARPDIRRKPSEWEAIQIAAAGDIESIDREIDEIDAELQNMNIKSTWFKPQLRLKDPRHFTWLLVGMYAPDILGTLMLTLQVSLLWVVCCPVLINL